MNWKARDLPLLNFMARKAQPLLLWGGLGGPCAVLCRPCRLSLGAPREILHFWVLCPGACLPCSGGTCRVLKNKGQWLYLLLMSSLLFLWTVCWWLLKLDLLCWTGHVRSGHIPAWTCEELKTSGLPLFKCRTFPYFSVLLKLNLVGKNINRWHHSTQRWRVCEWRASRCPRRAGSSVGCCLFSLCPQLEITNSKMLGINPGPPMPCSEEQCDKVWGWQDLGSVFSSYSTDLLWNYGKWNNENKVYYE